MTMTLIVTVMGMVYDSQERFNGTDPLNQIPMEWYSDGEDDDTTNPIKVQQSMTLIL